MMPKVVMFDLDGTLAQSKQPITPEMAQLLTRLLKHTRVAVVSGGALPQFLKQVVERLPHEANLHHLYLLPTSGGALYERNSFAMFRAHHDAWKKVYEEKLSAEDAVAITEAIDAVARDTGLIDLEGKSWGPHIEYRGSQESVSALGQQAPLDAKKAWDPDKSKRRMLQKALSERLPGFHVGMGGATTIDITKEGVDKAYGIRQLAKRLNIPEQDMLYVGDELEAGGNDEPVHKTEVHVRAVKDPSETKVLIESLIKN